MPISEFKAKIDGLIRNVKSSRLFEGLTEILLPSERGAR